MNASIPKASLWTHKLFNNTMIKQMCKMLFLFRLKHWKVYFEMTSKVLYFKIQAWNKQNFQMTLSRYYAMHINVTRT